MVQVKLKNKNQPKIIAANKGAHSDSLQPAIDFIEKNKDNIFFPDQYYPVVKSTIREDLQDIFLKNPGTPLNKVISLVIGELNPNIPGDKIIELATYAIQIWNGLLAKSQIGLESKPQPAAI